jgi:reactive intermediate/imine deaminase
MVSKSTKSEPLNTPNAAQPGGHYSQAVRLGETLYISGQLPVRADGSHSYSEPFETQVNIALDNLISIMAHAGCGLEDLVKATVYIVGIEHWPQFNALYAQRMGNVRPARAIVPVPALHHGYLIEIEGVAHCRQQ